MAGVDAFLHSYVNNKVLAIIEVEPCSLIIEEEKD